MHHQNRRATHPIAQIAASLLLAAALLPTTLPAQSRQLANIVPTIGTFGPVVDVDWLEEHLGEEGLVVFHVGSARDFEEAHIPTAVLVGLQDVSPNRETEAGPLRLEIPDPADLQEKLRGWGVSEDSRIVVTWTGNGVTQATRVMFALDWAGLGDQSALLDGGLAAWQAAGHPTATAPAQPAPGNVTVTPRPALVTDADWIGAHAHDEGIALLDARSQASFEGTTPPEGPAGHIPGASSLHWERLYDAEAGTLLPVEQRREILRAAGVEEGDTVIAYCHIGQWGSYVLFNARTLGHPVVLYDGSFQDWAARGLPLEKGPGGG